MAAFLHLHVDSRTEQGPAVRFVIRPLTPDRKRASEMGGDYQQGSEHQRSLQCRFSAIRRR